METPTPGAISAYVLAGGRSSRMGTDKPLLPLAGRLLIEHAVNKLRQLTSNVQILTSNPALARYAPLLSDIHPNTGPIGGLETALTHTTTSWNLFLPVDMPLVPVSLLRAWLSQSLGPKTLPGVHLIRTEDGRPQPGLCLVHCAVLPHLSQSIACGEYKLMKAFESADVELSVASLDDFKSAVGPEQRAAQHLWFANLNTPQDLAEAEAHCAALDSIASIVPR